MALIEYTLFGKINKVDIAIDRLRAFEPEEGYIIADSGGKDSTVIVALAQMAGIKHECIYNVTSVDPPEIVNFIREKHPNTHRQIPHDKGGNPLNMWKLIEHKGVPPTRRVRYCCEKLKETQQQGRLIVTGVRWAESPRRRKNQGAISIFRAPRGMEPNNNKGGLILNDDNDEARRIVEQCYRTSKTIINPIVDWKTEDVWEFIKTERLPYCGLYDEGFNRAGCICCPMCNYKARIKQLKRWPKYEENYLKAFARMIKANKERGTPRKLNWETPEEVMSWWLKE